MTNEERTLTLPYTSEYTWRAVNRADSPALHRLYAALDLVDGTAYAGSLSEVEQDFDDPDNMPERNSIAAFMPDGEIAALGWVLFNPNVRENYTPFLWGGVLPEHRRKGLGTFLFEWMEQRSSQILREIKDDLPKTMRTAALSTNDGKIALMEKRGFTARRYFLRMRRDLHQPLPTLPNLNGFKVVPFTGDLNRAVLDSKNEAFADHWHAEATTPEIWDLYFTGSESFRPDWSFQILDGSEVAAGSISRLRAEDNARAGVKEGWINLLWVRRAWRGRGIAKYILARCMEVFKAQGMDYAGLSVDADSPTGALRLYESMGFYPVQQNIAYFKDYQPERETGGQA